MADVHAFLQDAASHTGMSTEDILARVLHVDDGALRPFLASMDRATSDLVRRLDRELRIRNPGLHYVMRTMYVGYRREGAITARLGERSQVFASIIRSASRLEVVLPVDPDSVDSIPNAQDLRGKGHHGIGDVRVSLHNDSDIDRFLSDFDYWLRPAR
ncbi:hypothetical protein WDY80_24305 (plasmid) [Gordonia hongkongensis]|uniref:hypothetical protein n=1 Tax=Gordonia hongkongensis TaxID=1701090 RepID=UPI0030CBB5E2